MKEVLILIGFGEAAKKVEPFSPYTLLVEGEPQAFSEEKLEKDLLSFYQDFKVKGAERVKYFILFPPYESFTFSFRDIYRVVAGLHREAVLLPFESETFVLLPSVNSDRSAKAKCYRFFETLESTPPSGAPDLTWLLDTDLLPDHLVGDLLSLYLSTDIYRSFNAQAEIEGTKEKGHRYSSIGVAKLVFPAKRWHEYLSLMLVRELLGVRKISAFPVSLDTARMALSQLFPFLKAKLGRISEATSKPAVLPQAEILLEGLAVDEEERLEKFLARLKLYIDQEKAKRWEEIKPDAEIFYQEVRRELETTIDESPHGLYSAWGFIGLLLASSGPYVEFLRALDPWPEDLAAVSLQSFLFGWQEKTPSPPLDLLFKEVVRELRQFYQSRFLPFPEPGTWKALLEELCRLLAVPELDKVLGEGKEFIEALKKRIEPIVMAYENPYRWPLSGKNLEDILELLETRAREYLREVLREVSSVKKDFEELEGKITALGWKRYLPWHWSLLSRLRAQKAEFETAKMRLREAYLQVLERRRNLFACYFAPFAAERLSEILKPLEEEIEAFVSLTDENRSLVTKRMEGMDFHLPPFGFQVVETEEEIKKLFYHQFPPQDIPRLFDEFIQSFKKSGEPPPKLSDFYTPVEKRREFIKGLYTYSLAKFTWIQDWDVGKVITYLKKEDKMASFLEKKSGTFLHVKDPIPKDLQTAIFIGLNNENRNPFPDSAFSRPAPVFYPHRDPELIIGLRLSHGFPSSSVEGWENWKKCHEQEAKKD